MKSVVVRPGDIWHGWASGSSRFVVVLGTLEGAVLIIDRRTGRASIQRSTIGFSPGNYIEIADETSGWWLVCRVDGSTER